MSRFNDLDTRLLISLHAEQIIPVDVLKCRTVNVEEIKIVGGINEQSLKALQGTTFMVDRFKAFQKTPIQIDD